MGGIETVSYLVQEILPEILCAHMKSEVVKHSKGYVHSKGDFFCCNFILHFDYLQATFLLLLLAHRGCSLHFNYVHIVAIKM